MITFTKEELLKIAHLSALSLDENEITMFTQQIGSVLQFVEQLQQVDTTRQAQPATRVNVFGDDIARRFDNTKILAQSPDARDGYFAVPKILDEK